MATCRFGFTSLLARINPSQVHLDLARTLPGEVREWLESHDLDTEAPHTRLVGSYARSTAILDIKDIDVLLFLPTDVIERTPNSVLQELKRVLDEYPDSTSETRAQRRSVRLEFPAHDVMLDIVPAVADDGVDQPMRIPDRPAQEWIESDPIGYSAALSDLNGDHGGKVVPLVKLVKAWRDVQMQNRRPKSYVLEVMVFRAVHSGAIELVGQSTAENLVSFFSHVADKYQGLMDEGSGVPRVMDPQLGYSLTTKWERSHFETFMRRIRESTAHGRSALDADSDEDAASEWEKVFGDLWPTDDEIKQVANEAVEVGWPGKAYVRKTGLVSGTAVSAATPSKPTTFHGTDD